MCNIALFRSFLLPSNVSSPISAETSKRCRALDDALRRRIAILRVIVFSLFRREYNNCKIVDRQQPGFVSRRYRIGEGEKTMGRDLRLWIWVCVREKERGRIRRLLNEAEVKGR